MRIGYPNISRAAALLFVVLLLVPVAYADDPVGPPSDPDAKIKIPGGAPVQPRVLPHHGAPVQREILVRATEDPSFRILPPGGVPPQDEHSFRHMLMQWLARVGSPLD
jgi:hypothetical protein